MNNRSVYLLSFRQAPSQRAHFAIFIPNSTFPDLGKYVNVVGAPMAGYHLEIYHDYDIVNSQGRCTSHLLGEILAEDVSRLEAYASDVPPPPISQSFMAPVDGINNKRCQEWTAEYVRLLIQRELLTESALAIVQTQRDPPTHGIGLKPVTRVIG